MKFLGDIQLRFRTQGSNTWTDVSSHHSRKPAVTTSGTRPHGKAGVLTSADITGSFGSDIPIKVVRTWSRDRDSIIMAFNLTNVGSNDLQFGGVGIPLPFADNWVGRDAADTWERCAVSDPAISLDAGYVIANRLTGRAPTLITTPVEKSECQSCGELAVADNALTAPLEQFRLNYNTQPNYPEQWLDKVVSLS